MQNESNTAWKLYLGRFRRQIVPMSAPVRSLAFGVIATRKSFRKCNYEDRRALGLSKNDLGEGVRKKTWTNDETTIGKWKVFDGSEPRLALYSSLILSPSGDWARSRLMHTFATHQWKHQWLHQWIHQWIHHWIHDYICQWIYQWIRQRIHQWIRQWIHQHIHQWLR